MTLLFLILPSFLFTQNLRIDENYTLSIFMLNGSIQFYSNFQFNTTCIYYTIRLQNGVSCLYKLIYKTIVQRLTLSFTKCHTFKNNGMHMTGYILIHHNFLYDSAVLDLAFFTVLSKPAHR